MKKLIAALIASAFTMGAFAATPAPSMAKKEASAKKHPAKKHHAKKHKAARPVA